jgi:hypothetical protein
MFSSTFIFSKRQFDDDFYRLDEAIAEAAKSTSGYQVVISHVIRMYGDSKLAGVLPVTRLA